MVVLISLPFIPNPNQINAWLIQAGRPADRQTGSEAALPCLRPHNRQWAPLAAAAAKDANVSALIADLVSECRAGWHKLYGTVLRGGWQEGWGVGGCR